MKAMNGALSQNCRSHWITFRHGHQADFAAKLGGGELLELTRKSSQMPTTRYFSRAFNLSLSRFTKTKSLTETTAEGRLVQPRALDCAFVCGSGGGSNSDEG